MTKRVAALVLILSSLLAAPAAARFKGGAHWGYLAGDSFLDNDTFGYGVQGGFEMTDYFELELAGTFFNDNGAGLDIDVTSVALSMRFGGELPAGFRVYAGGGGSYNLTDIGAGPADTPKLGDAPGYHLCGGLSVPLGEHFELAGEYRHAWIAFDRTDHAALEDFMFDYRYTMLRASLSVRF